MNLFKEFLLRAKLRSDEADFFLQKTLLDGSNIFPAWVCAR